MNIAIDITPLKTEHGRRGVGVYTNNLIKSLGQYEKKHSYSFFTRGQKIPKNADIVHYPYFDPFFLTLPIIKAKPTVVTVHDVIPLVFPAKFPAGLRGNLKWQIQKLSLLGIRRVITDSESSKKDISKITGFDANRIDVVYLAPDPIFKPLRREKRTNPYVLYVGDVNWNKNVPGLLRAFVRVSNYGLKLVGGAFTDVGLRETKEINGLIRALDLEQKVTKVGYVTNEDLVGLYNGAAVLVQPSFYEGFGLPVLEAMACGCPVVSTDNSSLSEIAGPAVRVTTDPMSVADGIQTAIKERHILVRKGFEWVQKFTWKKVAAETVQTYEKA